MNELLERERQQLMAHWSDLFSKRPCWVEQPFTQIRYLAGERAPSRRRLSEAAGQDSKPAKPNDWVRKFHDRLGWCAKNEPYGRCVGAIYRTEAFIRLDPEARDGSAKGRNIHIEHTVPINELTRQWSSEVGEEARTVERVSQWFLYHSVATAVRWGEEKLIPSELVSANRCFGEVNRRAAKPFMRYAGMTAQGVVIWNVLDGQKIDVERFTLQEHYDAVTRLITEAGGSKGFAARLREYAP